MTHIKKINEMALDTANQDIVDYAEKYGNEALGYAIADMIKNGELELDSSVAGTVWEYGGNTGNN